LGGRIASEAGSNQPKGTILAAMVSAACYLGAERPVGVAGLKPALWPQAFRQPHAGRLICIRTARLTHHCDHDWSHANIALALALGFLCQNGCLQQIAANRFSTPQDVIAILLQGFVLPAYSSSVTLVCFTLARVPSSEGGICDLGQNVDRCDCTSSHHGCFGPEDLEVATYLPSERFTSIIVGPAIVTHAISPDDAAVTVATILRGAPFLGTR
jgi:hypothetical protein